MCLVAVRYTCPCIGIDVCRARTCSLKRRATIGEPSLGATTIWTPDAPLPLPPLPPPPPSAPFLEPLDEEADAEEEDEDEPKDPLAPVPNGSMFVAEEDEEEEEEEVEEEEEDGKRQKENKYQK